MTIDDIFYNHHKKYGNNRPDILKEAIKAEIDKVFTKYHCWDTHLEVTMNRTEYYQMLDDIKKELV